MKLAELMRPWVNIALPDCEISGLQNDSRQISPGFLFLAYPGAHTDGRLFISQAVASGASAIVYDPAGWSTAKLPEQVIGIPLENLAAKLGDIASRFYHYPAKKLTATGVTGTNGKTTIAYQLAQAYDLLGESAAYIGTIGQGKIAELKELGNTTPDALCLQQLLATYQQNAVQQVCMEVSSHALCQHRVDSIEFQQAIFTNLSHEHLDYHLTMEAYAKAKTLLFAKPTLKSAIINRDDSYYQLMKDAITAISCQVVSYGIKEEAADVRALNWQVDLTGTTFDVLSPWGQLQLKINALGFFNIYNALAIFSSLAVNNYPIATIASIMSKLQAAHGRMEVVSHEPYIIVDYAHTPDALENVLATLSRIKKNRLLVVFGCGGDRDKTKRPMMGKIAEQYSDIAIITSDNPRTEDPMTIIKDVEAGVANPSRIVKIVDRREAIAKALSLAEKDDIVLISGKGHETYQQIGNLRSFFSDQDAVRKLVNK
ncbi:UDP-N-acetylmuramoyl-L-alanyl-D-glutamate--2,6-diaminopimelate ligase [Legionella clemsonensis]|uniref:UDP-N-acetylmuramoyl-L-alanyl-D-glutamate--2,6-diaminopimelate ligase n=1 Tax=Legionella clemsonensis TaxID=1867846 RepID=A0A222P0S7_9GAMM|nr:UDP-N-acetylmuramoyl-L-alanyl-D-glutamate--2,6-diaminopimelate ligase [Legionella clemsonensis]ASQ45438.1 UDP-N-acetylmuramoyl-L-alanyl-D-glutamate--2,6-diaminopimelate ligase [Legionella clemsonensis]